MHTCPRRQQLCHGHGHSVIVMVLPPPSREALAWHSQTPGLPQVLWHMGNPLCHCGATLLLSNGARDTEGSAQHLRLAACHQARGGTSPSFRISVQASLA